MAPSSLQGLNLVHPVQQSYLSDSQDLLSNSQFPELNAHLDLWTNLAFQSDEPLVSKDVPHNLHHPEGTSPADEFERDDEDDEPPSPCGPAHADNHDNVSLGNQAGSTSTQPPAFDLNTILAGLGVDPFGAYQQQPPLASAPSLQQILSLYPARNFPSQPPPPAVPASSKLDSETPPTKRARARRSSVSTVAPDDSASMAASPTTPESGLNNLSASEDKRRRNTAASARFRLKKKEREAALEKKAKELETRVAELERECEGLRRENGWLKGLVVGVTGAGSTQQAGTKRAREGEDA